MSSTYMVLACAVSVLALGTALFGAGRAVGRMDEHLKEQDDQIAKLHRKLDGLREDERG